MAYQMIEGVRVWGNPDPGALSQAKTCAEHGNVVQTLLMADHHKGYSQPIGGVVVPAANFYGSDAASRP